MMGFFDVHGVIKFSSHEIWVLALANQSPYLLEVYHNNVLQELTASTSILSLF